MKDDKFTYSYCAPTQSERREIENIKSRYAAEGNGETKLERLKRLDAKVKRTPVAACICVGIAGCLVFGLGMALAMEWNLLAAGVAAGALGAAVMGANVFLHRFLLKRYKDKYGAEILKLSDELLNGK